MIFILGESDTRDQIHDELGGENRPLVTLLKGSRSTV
jgi:hypothetical protein